MNTVAAKSNRAYYIKSLIGIAVMFFFGKLPPIAPITELGMRLIGIFLGLMFLLCTVDVIWPSMLSVIALGMSGYCTVGEAIMNGFGSDMVWMMLVLLVLAEGMATSGIGEVIARWMITRKFLNKRPFLFTFVFMAGFGICSLLVTSFVSVVLSWSIFYSIADMVGYRKGERYSTILIIGTFLSCLMYEGLFAFQSWLLALSQAYQRVLGEQMNYALFFVIGFITVTLMVLFIVLAMKYIFRCDFEKLKNFDVSTLSGEGSLHLTKRHKAFLACFGAIVGYVFVTTLLPSSWPVIAFLQNITQAGWFTMVLTAAVILRVEGEPLIDFPEIAKTGVNWSIIMMCTSIIPVAYALTSEGTGVGTLLNNVIAPVVSGMPAGLFLVAVIALMIVLANLAGNMAVGVVMITTILPLSGNFYYPPSLIGMAMILVASLGFYLPGSSGMAPFLHSNPWIRSKDVYTYGAFCALCFFAAIVPVFLLASFIL